MDILFLFPFFDALPGAFCDLDFFAGLAALAALAVDFFVAFVDDIWPPLLRPGRRGGAPPAI